MPSGWRADLQDSVIASQILSPAKNREAYFYGFARGTKVRLNAAGCVVPEQYEWWKDPLAPGDVGEVVESRRNGDMRIRGPNGKLAWYEKKYIEVTTEVGKPTTCP